MVRIRKVLKTYGITIWLIAAVMLLASFISYAKYMEEQNRVKRVVANTAESGQLFASDYLSVGTPAARRVPFSGSASEYILSFKIWNYNPADPVKYYNKSLNYTLSAQLVDHNGNAIAEDALDDRRIGWKRGTGEYVYFSTYTGSGYLLSMDGSFAGTMKEEHSYQIKFDERMLRDGSDIYVKVTAVPNRRELDALSATLGVMLQEETLTQGWIGDFNDDTGLSVARYDGFNYVISGNGTATLTFQWDSSKLAVNPFFLSDHGLTPSTVGETAWKSVTIAADGATVNRYDIQLYMTGSAEDYTDWTAVRSYVRFSAE